MSDSKSFNDTDLFCISKDFEEWASLPPFKLPLSKNGDGEYENDITKHFHRCFFHAYTKGMWGSARKINGQLCDRVAKLEAIIDNIQTKGN